MFLIIFMPLIIDAIWFFRLLNTYYLDFYIMLKQSIEVLSVEKLWFSLLGEKACNILLNCLEVSLF